MQKLVTDILIFLEFANFYQRFIEGFTRIAALLILMLKTITSVTSAGTLLKPIYNCSFLRTKAKRVFTWLKETFINLLSFTILIKIILFRLKPMSCTMFMVNF